MMHPIAGRSFCKTKSSGILYRVRNLGSCYLIYGSNTSYYEGFLNHETVQLIVGIGDYTGRDTSHIRIESYCTNKFRNDLIDHDQLYRYDLFIPESFNESVFKIGTGMGNGHCNHACRKLSKYIASSGGPKQLIFFHLPKKFPSARAVEEIDTLLRSLGG